MSRKNRHAAKVLLQEIEALALLESDQELHHRLRGRAEDLRDDLRHAVRPFRRVSDGHLADLQKAVQELKAEHDAIQFWRAGSEGFKQRVDKLLSQDLDPALRTRLVRVRKELPPHHSRARAILEELSADLGRVERLLAIQDDALGLAGLPSTEKSVLEDRLRAAFQNIQDRGRPTSGQMSQLEEALAVARKAAPEPKRVQSSDLQLAVHHAESWGRQLAETGKVTRLLGQLNQELTPTQMARLLDEANELNAEFRNAAQEERSTVQEELARSLAQLRRSLPRLQADQEEEDLRELQKLSSGQPIEHGEWRDEAKRLRDKLRRSKQNYTSELRERVTHIGGHLSQRLSMVQKGELRGQLREQADALQHGVTACLGTPDEGVLEALDTLDALEHDVVRFQDAALASKSELDAEWRALNRRVQQLHRVRLALEHAQVSDLGLSGSWEQLAETDRELAQAERETQASLRDRLKNLRQRVEPVLALTQWDLDASAVDDLKPLYAAVRTIELALERFDAEAEAHLAPLIRRAGQLREQLEAARTKGLLPAQRRSVDRELAELARLASPTDAVTGMWLKDRVDGAHTLLNELNAMWECRRAHWAAISSRIEGLGRLQSLRPWRPMLNQAADLIEALDASSDEELWDRQLQRVERLLTSLESQAQPETR